MRNKIGGARELFRQIGLPVLGGGAGAHRRRHAPRQERRPGGETFDLALADGLQAKLHDLVIGAAGAEAEQARRRARFQLAGEIGQFVEQAVIVDQLFGAPHLLGHLGQPLLDAVDRGLQPLRLRQAEQRQRAIGFQLDDALHQRAGALGAEAAVEQQDAHEAGGVGLEIGREQRVAFGILRHREAGAVEQPVGSGRGLGVAQEMQVERDQQRARLRQRRHRRRQRARPRDGTACPVATAAPRCRW